MVSMCQKATFALGEPPLSVTALRFQRSEIRINTEALCGECVECVLLIAGLQPHLA